MTWAESRTVTVAVVAILVIEAIVVFAGATEADVAEGVEAIKWIVAAVAGKAGTEAWGKARGGSGFRTNPAAPVVDQSTTVQAGPREYVVRPRAVVVEETTDSGKRP